MTAFRRLKPRAPEPDELWLGAGAFGVFFGGMCVRERTAKPSILAEHFFKGEKKADGQAFFSSQGRYFVREAAFQARRPREARSCVLPTVE